MDQSFGSKLGNFSMEALTKAQEISSQILSQVEADRSRLYEEGVKAIRAEVDDKININKAKIDERISYDISHLNIEKRQNFLLHREAVSKRIYEAVKSRLLDYTKTDEYVEHLKRLCAAVITGYGRTWEIYLSKEDMKHAEVLGAHIESLRQDMGKRNEITFTEDKNIRLGGLRFYDKNRGIMINETLDQSLEQSKNDFTSMLGAVLSDI
ncbi:MAG: V-type ATP synthase subunit E [Eubacteriales bacterium]